MAEYILTLYAKIKSLSVMLWEAERENVILKEELAAKDAIIKDLNIDIYFSDLELQDIKGQLDLAEDLKYMHSLYDKINDLNKSNQILSDIIKQSEISF
jgi:hypothetical protein